MSETYLLHLLKPTYNNTKQRVEEFSSEDSSLKVSTLIQKQLSHFCNIQSTPLAETHHIREIRPNRSSEIKAL